jgi:hypothetical protein
MSPALRSAGRLDALSSTPAAPSGRALYIHAYLHLLATNSGEKRGLGVYWTIDYAAQHTKGEGKGECARCALLLAAVFLRLIGRLILGFAFIITQQCQRRLQLRIQDLDLDRGKTVDGKRIDIVGDLSKQGGVDA